MNVFQFILIIGFSIMVGYMGHQDGQTKGYAKGYRKGYSDGKHGEDPEITG